MIRAEVLLAEIRGDGDELEASADRLAGALIGELARATFLVRRTVRRVHSGLQAIATTPAAAPGVAQA